MRVEFTQASGRPMIAVMVIGFGLVARVQSEEIGGRSALMTQPVGIDGVLSY